MSAPTPERVSIYDTTLRDGTQGEGVSFSSLDKLRIAKKLDEFGVDYIEGGWPGSNPKDVEFFQQAKEHAWQNARIAAFGSTRRKDVAVEDDPQVALLIDAETPVVTYVGKSWKLHVTEILGTTVEENQAMIRDTAAHLKKHGREVIYDAEHFFDGYKDDAEHAMATLQAAKEGGAEMVVLCDTNGGTMPSEVEDITRTVMGKLQMPVGIHPHDDCGVGVANALAGVVGGATQVQGTVNGFGERTGNCNLTSTIPNLNLKLGIDLKVDLSRLTEVSRFVNDLANHPHHPRAPYVGESAFAHKGGMHVNAVQKVARSFEHIEPKTVGNRQRILVSELSGQSNVLMKAEELGLPLEKGSAEVKSILEQLKTLEKEGYEFEAAEASFELLIRKLLGDCDPYFHLREYHCSYRRHADDVGDYETCEATVKIRMGGERIYTVAEGGGPVNALDAALRKALMPTYPEIKELSLLDYKVRIVDSHMGTAAKTRVLIVSSDGSESWGTVGVSSNIIEASWRALVDSIEVFLMRRGVKPS